MSVPVAGIGFVIATFAMLYFGAVFYAETVGATIDQMMASEEASEFEEF